MVRSAALLSVAMMLIAAPAGAQMRHDGNSPYAELEKRAIKALSDEQIADLRAGRGMMLALPAELNGYPGPKHVLELAGRLDLTADQRVRVTRLEREMSAETQALGAEVIAAEVALDRLFAGRTATAETVAQATATAANAQGTLRAAHLKYHLATVEVLTPAQVTAYSRLRGYVRS